MTTSGKRFFTQHFIVIGCCIFLLFSIFIAFNDRPANAFSPGKILAGLIGAKESHQSITEKAMKSLANEFFQIQKLTKPMEKAVKQVSDANEKIDKNQKTASWHVDGESFSDAQLRIIECANSVTHFLHNSTSSNKEWRVGEARNWLGSGLHTIQDFYSHSNWVEMENSSIHPQFGKLNQSISKLPRETPTCKSCDPPFVFCSGNIVCPNNLLNNGLTSGYYAGEDFPYNLKYLGKCSHGSNTDGPIAPDYGINKDGGCIWSPHSQYHEAATMVALAATIQFIRDVKATLTDREAKELFGVLELGVAIDATQSMESKIAGIKAAAIQLVDSRTNTNEEPASFILSVFRDPEIDPVVSTSDPTVFKNAINAIQLTGNPDCPEASMGGMLSALKAMSGDSKLFLYTDASSKDTDLRGNVVATAKEKGIEIYPTIGSCSPTDPAYIRIADDTGGQAFSPASDAEYGSVAQQMDFLAHSDVVDILSVYGSVYNETKNYTAPVDSTMTRVTFSVSGGAIFQTGTTNVTVSRPDGSIVSSTDPNVTSSALSRGLLMSIVKPTSATSGNWYGTWAVTVGGASEYSLRISGESSLYFSSFRFMEIGGRPGHQGYYPINGQPLIGQTYNVDATLTNGEFSTAQFELRRKDGSVLQAANLSEVQDTPGGPFREFAGNMTLPIKSSFGVPGFIYVIGQDNTGRPFQRVWPSLITAQTVQIIAPSAKDLIPGQTTNYSFQIKNLNAYLSAYLTVVADDDTSWLTSSTTPQNLVIPPGGGVTVQASIATPSTAIPGTEHKLRLAANDRTFSYNFDSSNYVVLTSIVTTGADTQSPYITCQSPMTVTAPAGQNSAVVSYQLPTANDNRSIPNVTCLPQSGTAFPIGATTVNCTAVDAAGNSASCSFTITVTGSTDTQPPTIACLTNLFMAVPYGQSSITLDYAPPKVSDDRAGATYTCSPPSGSTFYRGTTTVTCTATDTSGNMASCSFNVAIYDVSLQDDRSGDTLLFNSITGDYIFYRCGANGFTLSGKGSITRQGCLVKLGGDPKVSATLDSCVTAPANRGSATIKPNPIGGWLYITDSNTTNNTPPCPNG